MKAVHPVKATEDRRKDGVTVILENTSLTEVRNSKLSEANTVKVSFSGGSDSIVPGDACSLARAVIAMAASRGLRISTAESCTGGLLSGALTETPGSSEVFPGGVICYSNEAKIRLLEVPPLVIREHGAVSGECALFMARGAKAIFGTDIACSVTGIAGPGGATAEKPVGLVWFSVVSPTGERTFSRHFEGSRSEIRFFSVHVALEALWRSTGGRNNDR